MSFWSFRHGVRGMVLNLEEDNVGAVLLGDATNIEEGDIVKTTGTVVEVPVGDEMIGQGCQCPWTADRWQRSDLKQEIP